MKSYRKIVKAHRIGTAVGIFVYQIETSQSDIPILQRFPIYEPPHDPSESGVARMMYDAELQHLKGKRLWKT